MGFHGGSPDNEGQRRDRHMITMYWRGEEDLYRSLVRIERSVDSGSGELVRFAAEWLVNDIRSNWSNSQQTVGSGNPPAIKTGNLDSAVIADRGRDVMGRFATADNVKVAFVRVDTAAGVQPDNRGNYAQVLEFEYNLPFVQPAVQRLEAVYPDLGKRFIRL